jgi:hypothetical protein
VLESEKADFLLKQSSRNREVIHPFLIGRDVLTGDGQPTRWVIDFHAMPLVEASAYSLPFARIKDQVLPDREKNVTLGQTHSGAPPHHALFLEALV